MGNHTPESRRHGHDGQRPIHSNDRGRWILSVGDGASCTYLQQIPIPSVLHAAAVAGVHSPDRDSEADARLRLLG
jgi:hypothetical protein